MDGSEGDRNGSLRLAPAFERALPAIEADLRARLERFGIADRVAVRFVDAIGTRRPIEADGEVIPAGTPIPFATGRYHQRLIEVALASLDRTQTFGHEVIHALRKIGVFRDAEWRTLDRVARVERNLMADIRRRYEGMPLSESELAEEAIAEMFGDWLSGQTRFLRTVFERIRDFLRALGQALRGQGLQTHESVFRSIERGEIGVRSGKSHRVSRCRRSGCGRRPAKSSAPTCPTSSFARQRTRPILTARAWATLKHAPQPPLPEG